MKHTLLHILGLLGAVAVFTEAQGQIPVRGLPSAARVYNAGTYGVTLPASPYVYNNWNAPAVPPAAYSTYRPIVGYVPQGYTSNGYVTAGYAPVAGPGGYAGVTTGYAPAGGVVAPAQYFAPVAPAAPVVTGYAPQPLATPLATPQPAAVDPGYATPIYSPFVRPAPNYTPPNFAYRPSYAPNYVTYYRPVTVYDPATGVPVTYMGACRGTECRAQPQYSWFGSWFNHKPCTTCGTCATGSCGAQPAVPYYPAPAGALPGATIPTGPAVVVPTTPTTPPPAFGTPPAAIPFGAPALPRTTVPPPATVFPGGIGVPGAVPVAPGGTGNPADLQPRLNYPPATDPATANYPPSTSGTTPQPSQGFTNDGGKTYYYYRGTVKEAFSEQPASATGNEVGTGVQKPAVSEPMNGLQAPLNNVPQNSGPQGFLPSVGPLKVDARPSGVNVETKPTQPSYQNTGRLAPIAPEIPSIEASKALHPSIRPLPDPEPNGPANRAPQLLNPRDKTT